MGVLAQIDPKAAADGLVGPAALGWIIVGLVIALAFVVKYAIDQNSKHATELATLQKAKDDAVGALQATLLATVKADAEEQRKLLIQVMPLSTKLLEMIELTREDE